MHLVGGINVNVFWGLVDILRGAQTKQAINHRYPLAYRGCLVFFGWCHPRISMIAALLASAPLIFITFITSTPRTGSLTQILAPLTAARAMLDGTIVVNETSAPFLSLILLITDFFAASPGQTLLWGKGVIAILVSGACAYFSSVRLPLVMAVVFSFSLVAMCLHPAASLMTSAFSLSALLAMCFVCHPVHDSEKRAYIEGFLGGFLSLFLILTQPVMAWAVLFLTTACPIFMGVYRGQRYVMSMAILLIGLMLIAVLTPQLGIMILNDMGKSTEHFSILHYWNNGAQAQFSFSSTQIVALLLSFLVVTGIFLSAGFIVCKKNMTMFILCLYGFLVTALTPAMVSLMILLCTVIFCFGVKSPLYYFVYKTPSRSGFTLTLCLALVVSLQFLLLCTPVVFNSFEQFQYALREEKREQLTQVEQRFDVKITNHDAAVHIPIDEIVRESEAVEGWDEGDVAILMYFDLSCLLVEAKPCHGDGFAAAQAAKIVLVPQIKIDPASDLMIAASEGFLYTHFKKIGETGYMDIWQRRASYQ